MKSFYDYPEVHKRTGTSIKLGCIMLEVGPLPVFQALGESFSRSALYFSRNETLRYVQGAVGEDGAHVTLLYGLTPDENAGPSNRESVDELLAGLDLSTVLIDGVSSFPSQFSDEKYSAIVGHVDLGGSDIAEANRRLRFLPHVDTFPDYKAHVTLAYVYQEFTAEAIVKLGVAFNGRSYKTTGINYGGPY